MAKNKKEETKEIEEVKGTAAEVPPVEDAKETTAPVEKELKTFNVRLQIMVNSSSLTKLDVEVKGEDLETALAENEKELLKPFQIERYKDYKISYEVIKYREVK